MRWYLAHDPGPLPHLFRVLWLFWTAQDLEREAWSWKARPTACVGRVGQPAWPHLRRVEAAWTVFYTAPPT